MKENVQLKKVTSKDKKAAAQEEGHLKLINIFVVVGYNFKKTIRYKVSNDVGKMEQNVYIEILKQLLTDPEWQRQGLTLVQDKDSAHTAKKATKFCEKQGLSTITFPGNSLDFSILETMTRTYKKRFHARRVKLEAEGLKRFEQIFNEEVGQKKI